MYFAGEAADVQAFYVSLAVVVMLLIAVRFSFVT